jgi:hypothetical protein
MFCTSALLTVSAVALTCCRLPTAAVQKPITVDVSGSLLICRAGNGEGLVLTEENVEAVLVDCRAELGTLFGYLEENRGVGITGTVDFVELEGPTVVVELNGRFWHQKQLVLDRIASFIQARIPECVEVVPSDPSQLSDADPAREGQPSDIMGI